MMRRCRDEHSVKWILVDVRQSGCRARAATSGGWGGGVCAQAKPVHALSMQAATALKTLAFNKARREFENKLFMLKVLKIEVELRPQEQAA
mgnify:CR=1 FL=1